MKSAMRRAKIVVTRLYNGQGLGNQLWVYGVTRAYALRNQIPYRIECHWRFKGKELFNFKKGRFGLYSPLRYPKKNRGKFRELQFIEEKIRVPGLSYDFSPFKEIPYSNRRIRLEGNFESEKYLFGIEDELKNELQVTNPIDVPENICIINVRGGDYLGSPEILLDSNYYSTAMDFMKNKYKQVEFAIITDDLNYARKLLPGVPVLSTAINDYLRPNSSDIGKIEIDFNILQNAKKLIIGNSSFAWWATWTNTHSPFVIAPRFWDSHKSEIQVWAPNSILTKEWFWLSKEGVLRSYDEESNLLSLGKIRQIEQISEAETTANWIIGKPKHFFKNWIFKKIGSNRYFQIVNAWRKRLL